MTNISLCEGDGSYGVNETCQVKIPRLMIKSYYPFDTMNGTAYYMMLGFQFYYLLYSMLQANQADVLFCSWVLFCCEQLQHLKVNLILILFFLSESDKI